MVASFKDVKKWKEMAKQKDTTHIFVYVITICLIFLLVSGCSSETQEKPISQMTCSEVEDAYAACDEIGGFVSHIRICRERYYPALWRCYGTKAQYPNMEN